MEIPRTPILEPDILTMSTGRVTVEPGKPDVMFIHREVNIPINLLPLLNPNPNVYIANLIFIDCIFFEPVDLGGYESAGKVSFQNCEFLSNVSIQFIDNITIAPDCYFRQDLTIKLAGGNLKISELSIDGQLKIEGAADKLVISHINSSSKRQNIEVSGKFSELEVSYCYFSGLYIYLYKESMITISYSYGRSTGLIAFEGNCEIDVYYCDLKQFILTLFGKENNLYIGSCKIIEELELDMSKCRDILVRLCNIDKLKILEKSKNEDLLVIEDCTLTHLSFWHLVNKGHISLSGLDLPKEGILEINSSSLGNTEFINCDFSAATLEFENSRVTEVFLAETDFPRRVELQGRVNPRQAQLAFGQLRTALNRQGDTVRALEYQAREIEAHYHNIKSFWRKQFPFLHFTKLNLALNRLSNNFGRDWGRGLVFSIAIGLLCFTGLVWTTKEYSFHGHWQFDRRLIASFARFMNPLRFFDLETLFTQNNKPPFVTLTWGSYVLDYLGRISIAYGYYQTIQAFRRYGRN